MANKRARYTTTTRTTKRTKYVPRKKYIRAKKGRGTAYRKRLAPGFKTTKVVRRFPKKKKIVRLDKRVRTLERKVANTTNTHHRVTIRDGQVVAQANGAGYSQITRNGREAIRGLLSALPQRNVPNSAVTNIAVVNAPDSRVQIRSAATTVMKNIGTTGLTVRIYILEPKEPTAKSPIEYLQNSTDWYGGYFTDTTSGIHEAPFTSGQPLSRHWYPSENPQLMEEWKIVSTKNYFMRSGAQRRIKYNRNVRVKLMDVDQAGDDMYDRDLGSAIILFRVVGVYGADLQGDTNLENFDTIASQLKFEDESHMWVSWEGGDVPVRTKEVIVQYDDKLETNGVVPQVVREHQDYFPAA